MRKFILLSFMAFGVQGCIGSDYYLKTVAAKDAKISSDIKVAVLPENWYTRDVSNFMPRALITEFIDLGFTVVERSKLEEIFKELYFDSSGAVKESTTTERGVGYELGVLDRISIKKIGEMLGVDALLITYVVPTHGDNIGKATFRLVDVETAKILFSTTFINTVDELKSNGSVSLKEVIESISKSVAAMVKGDKRYFGKRMPRRNLNGSLSN